MVCDALSILSCPSPKGFRQESGTLALTEGHRLLDDVAPANPMASVQVGAG